MIKTITVTNALAETVVFDLRSPEQSGFFIRSVNGLGPVKATINTSEALAVDGVTFNSARLSSRNIVFGLGFLEKPTIEDTRQASYKLFPLKSRVSIVVETDNKTVRTNGYVESNEPDIFSKEEGNTVSIICEDPYFHSLTSTIVNFSAVTSLFSFPFSNESLVEKLIVFGDILLTPQQTIIYTGEAPVGFVMRVHAVGPVRNLVLYNLATREFLKINSTVLEELIGSDIIAGDDIIISTVVGNKYVTLVRDGQEINILHALDNDSSWFNLIRGENKFYYSAEIGHANLMFSIEHDIAYEGI